MLNRHTASIESCLRTDGHVWLKLGKGRLAARLWQGAKVGQKIILRIRPEDILLSVGHPGLISARNVLPGHVLTIKMVPEGTYIKVNVGFPLTALLTRGAVAQLGLRRGTAVFAIIKASAVIPEARAPQRFKVSLIGTKGDVDPRMIEFLRAIDLTGSLSAASREMGITYRTAWMWMRSINRSWGSTLLARTHGGRGGGGTSLTPEGRAALSFVASVENPG